MFYCVANVNIQPPPPPYGQQGQQGQPPVQQQSVS